MTEPVKWLFFDITTARYVDDDDVENYLLNNPSSVLVEVSVEENNVLPSGTGAGLIPEKFPSLLRQNFQLYELCISGSLEDNIYIVSSGNVIQAGFLPYSGGVLLGDLILDHDPTLALEAATKQYVDQASPLSYMESETASDSTTSATFEVINGMTITPPSGIYYASFSCSAEHSGNNLAECAIFVNSTVLDHTVRPFDNDGGFFAGAYSAEVTTQSRLTVDGTEEVDVRFRTTGGTFTVNERNFVLVKVS